MSITPVNNNLNYFNILHDDNLFTIFSFLPKTKDIHSVLLTNRRFYTFASTYQPLWHSFLASHFPLSSPPSPILPDAKEIYKKRKTLEKNIRENKCRSSLLRGHKVNCLAIQQNILVSGSQDRIVQIKDLTAGTEKTIQTEHAVTCIAVHGDLFCTGSHKDNPIDVWSLKTGKKLVTLEGHQKGIHCLVFHNGHPISSSADQSIKVWDLKSGKELHTWERAHNGPIFSLTIHGDTLYSCGDENIKSWDLGSKEELFRLEALTKVDLDQGVKVNCIEIRGNILFSGQSNGCIKMWDLKDKKILRYFAIPRGINSLVVQGNVLLAASNDSAINAWNVMENTQRFPLLVGHNSWLSCLAVQDGVLFSGSLDQTIKIWDFNFLPLTPYDQKTLEENLSLLEKISQAVEEGLTREAKTIAQQLHPDFQERLRQHGFRCTGSFKITKEVIERVQTELRLELLLDRLHAEDQKKVSQILNQIEKINDSDQSIYWHLTGLIFKRYKGTSEPGKAAFHGHDYFRASLEEKERAVMSFKADLKKNWGPDFPLLLVDFGIVTDAEYSQKLQCRPDILAKVGILSLADLQALGLLCVPPLAHIELPAEIPGQEKQAQLGAKRKVVTDLLEKLSEEIQTKCQESDYFGVILFTDENGNPIGQELSPWGLFQKQFEETKKQIEEICSSPKNLANDNGELLAKANALIDQFNAVEREYQIAKLHAYIQQPLIQEKWTSLDASSLADYAKKNPAAKLFEMGAQSDFTVS